jgi:vacuolar protein sorting-associated protein 26
VQDGDDVKGKIKIEMLKGKSKVDHLGIRVELIGVIENLFDKNQTTNFINLGQELEPPGVLTDSCEYTFSFNRVEKKFESYNGIIVRLRYFVNVVINRNYNRITKEEEFIVYNPIEETSFVDKPIKMEVGIEDCLHIEFEFSRAVYTLKDCILGKVFFNLVRIKIKHMELNIIRKETFGTGEKAVTESENLTKFEIMDGAPVKGECIPVRFYLASVELTPTYESINKRFSVRYYINLVLVDEEDRRYFKQ